MDPRFSDSVPKSMVDFAVWVASADFPNDESMPIDLNRPSTYVKNLEEPDMFSKSVMKDFRIGVEIF